MHPTNLGDVGPAGHVHPEVVTAMRESASISRIAVPSGLTTELAERGPRRDDGRSDTCPYIPGKRYLDWDLPDPKGQAIEAVRATRDEIARRVEGLIAELDEI